MNTSQQLQYPRSRAANDARNTKRRLARLQTKLEGIRDALIRIHRDETGWQRIVRCMPLLEEQWNGKAGFSERFARVQSDAAQGCELSAAFVAQWQEVAGLCDRLRHIAPPEAMSKRQLTQPGPENGANDSAIGEVPDDWELESLMEVDTKHRGT